MATNPALTQQASRGRDDPVVTGLVTRARNGEQQAWDALAERHAPLIWSICRRAPAGGRRRPRTPPRTSGSSSRISWTKSATRPRCPAGWPPPPPGAHAAAPCARPGGPAALGMRWPPGPSPAITPSHPGRTCSRPNGTPPCARRSGSCPRAASSCSPCSSTTPRCRTPRSAPGWASRSAASGRPAAAAWTSYAATRPSPRWSTPAPRPPRHMHDPSEREGSSLPLCVPGRPPRSRAPALPSPSVRAEFPHLDP